MTTPFLPGVIIFPAWNDDRVGVEKRARDEDLLALLEADSRGWSSSVPERSLALRRRRAPPSSFSHWGCGWVAAAAAEEHGCRGEEASAVGSGAEDEEKAMVDPCFLAYCSSNLDCAAFAPPPMATSLLPLCVFIADLFKGRNDDRISKLARDRDLPALSEDADACVLSSEAPERRLQPGLTL